MLDIIPYRQDKNLGKAYNDVFRDTQSEVICLRDGDSMFLTPDYGNILDEYHILHPDAVLTCYTNRVSTLSKMQLLTGRPSEDPDIRHHIKLAENQRQRLYKVTELNCDISGTLMVVPREVWELYPFPQLGTALGVDTAWNRTIRAAGVKILRMDGLYIWHTYRLLTGINSKEHLK